MSKDSIEKVVIVAVGEATIPRIRLLFSVPGLVKSKFTGHNGFRCILMTLLLGCLSACDQADESLLEQAVVADGVNYHLSVESKVISDRDLVVWLPPGYVNETDKHYPVLYLHDGQNLFDSASGDAGEHWAVDEAMERLIQSERIEPMIVVGIYNSADRKAEYSPGEEGSAYMNFVITVVKPLIDKTYRTRPGREHTFVGGSSLGGTMAFMLAWDHPDIFSGAICMSPAFKLGKGKASSSYDFIPYFEATHDTPRDVFFYIDNGVTDQDEILQPGTQDMLAALKRWGYTEGDELVFIHDRSATQSETAWAKRFPTALILTIQGAVAINL